MNTQKQIDQYIDSQPEPKRTDMRALHNFILRIMSGRRLWFLDGRDERGKIVSNPNIGYGNYAMKSAGGKTRDFYQIGLSGNTGGISVYVMGIADRKLLSDAYAQQIGKATVTGYCIKFKYLKDISLDVLEAAIRSGLDATSIQADTE